MTTQVKIKLCGVGNSDIHGGSGRDISASSYLVLAVGTEQSGVVSLLDHDEGNTGLVSQLQLHAGLSHGTQLVL